ncbi:MAG: C25 family cysteine peptidase [Pyrinomonadaceae bacterium MAG19_C2-C3]|nr:C25 family cysteine peptidase [Pyrinomonadaceae bacterium MAG19_C2-C3]
MPANPDTDNNNLDFVTQTPTPRNTESQNGTATLAELIFFSAVQANGAVSIKWQTGNEVNNLGYNIYREQNGTRMLLNKSIIAGSAFMVGAGTQLVAGKSYMWSDRLASDKNEGAQYWLEEIDLDGTRTMHNPVTPGIAASGEKSLPASSVMLNELAAQGEKAKGNVERQWTKSSFLLASNASPQAFITQRRIAAGSAVKIAVKRAGWYRVTQAELVAAGLNANTDPRRLQLYADGNEVPMRVAGEENGAFGADKYIEFYGIGFDTAANDTRTYWLVAGDANGKRIQFSAAPKSARAFRGRTRGAYASASSVAPNSFAYTTERKDRFIYFSNLLNGNADNFFGNVVTMNEHTETLTAHDLALSSATPNARLEVALQGASAGEHQVALFFNDAKIGTLNYTGMTRRVTTLDVPAKLLRAGANNVKLVAEIGSSDVSLVDYLRLTYPRRFRAVDNALAFDSATIARVEGFTNNRMRAIDVTRPDDVREVVATVQPETNGSFTAMLAAPARGTASRSISLFTDDRFERPVSVTANRPANLHDATQAADLIVITTEDLRASLEPLVALRQGQGLRVIVVNVEDIYDEWNFGNPHSAAAVRDFLKYTMTNWQGVPRYVLLGGDASLDPRNYLGRGDFDAVPTRLIDTSNMETASDEWIVDFDEDGIGELAIGRLPARNAAEANRMVAKIVGNIAGVEGRAALLFADSRVRDGFDFVTTSQAATAAIPQSIREELNRNPDEATTHADFIAAVNRGPLVVNYFGHGSIDLWSGAGFFSNGDALALTNGSRLPFFTLMTCLNGYYHDPGLDSLAESLLKAENGGAVAVWASSGMTAPQSQALVNQELYRGLFAENSMTLGDAVRRAKAATTDSDVRRTWILFGDPSMRFQ